MKMTMHGESRPPAGSYTESRPPIGATEGIGGNTTTAHQRESEASKTNGETEHGRSMPGLVAELLSEASALGRAEFALARNEMQENLNTAKRGVMSMGAGGAVLAGGLLSLVACAILALSLVWPAWLSALVVGGILSIIGAIMLGAGRSKMKAEQLKPKRTQTSMRENGRFVRRETSRAVEKWS